MRESGSGGGCRKLASSEGEGPSGVSSRLRSGSTTGNKRIDTNAVLVSALDRRLHKPDDSVLTDVLLKVIPGVGRPSASSSSYLVADDTSVERLPQHPPHPAENIRVLPSSSAADANVQGLRRLLVKV